MRPFSMRRRRQLRARCPRANRDIPAEWREDGTSHAMSAIDFAERERQKIEIRTSHILRRDGNGETIEIAKT